MYLDFFADSNMPVFPKYSLISHYDFNKVRIIKDIFTILSVSSFVLPYTLLSRLNQQLDKYKELIKREFDDTELTGPEPKLTGDYERGRKAVVDDSTEASGEWKLKRPMEDDTSISHLNVLSSSLKPEEIEVLCKRFAPLAARYCRGLETEQQFVGKCWSYTKDCLQEKAGNKFLEAAANAFISNVGGVNGIPYYPFNSEGSVNGGHDGKVDFRSWGGGYTDTVRVREYFSQTNESRGNWHQGVYGYRTGWFVSVGNLFGIEGGRSVSLNEADTGKTLSTRKAFASLLLGVSGSRSCNIGFPGFSALMRSIGLGSMHLLVYRSNASKSAVFSFFFFVVFNLYQITFFIANIIYDY
ncbi:unnamed protein product [Enterobius vermicularis]|uniref:Pept_C1 domain-containing protein n=1 Tax=Enterobius vermicularis TaxID=51028 RepID=A0A0N4UT40_ENTVE|nr:unnamed protein product [Enterobius vermicularis]